MKKHLLVAVTMLFVAFFSLSSDAFAQSMMPIPNDYSVSRSTLNAENELYLPPKAIIKVRNNTGNKDQLSGTTATTFTFNGNGSYDTETSSSDLEVRYDFENNGIVDTYFSRRKIAKHIYETPGWKTVKMEVLDLEGNVSEATQKIYVVENTRPEAHFTISPEIGTPGTRFNLKTNLSSDDQYASRQLYYRFDFDGDGVYDTKYRSKTTWDHKFDKPGLKNVTLEVRDPEGATSTYSQLVFVKENSKPKADFKITPIKQGDDFVRYELDASESYDLDDKKLSYKWDFDYNGKNDIQWNTTWYRSNKAYATFYKSGKYIVRLLVHDKDGSTDESFATLIVNLISDSN
ncbi:PKD domain-containing protein [Patescibacteria group bacterium]